MDDNEYEYYLEFTDDDGNVTYLTPDAYSELTSAGSLYGDTPPHDLYKAWKEYDGTLRDLQDALSYFEKDELYEHCAAIQKLIEEKLAHTV